jgi:hypothetical protein
MLRTGAKNMLAEAGRSETVVELGEGCEEVTIIRVLLQEGS